ncbi:hypothetical protein PIB30_041830 [Stylosanthes scabra]|uniref:Uncharacterized protein n=1 Tax=Stylosanthes scabra TaxID=79078 RepID=A0ABU6QEH7_9FABA|nr:hypothetical protein [Stylosanthes scabra]
MGRQRLSVDWTLHVITENAHVAITGPKTVFDVGFMEPQLGVGSRSNDVAIDAYANPNIMQDCESIALGRGVLNLFDKQSNNG